VLLPAPIGLARTADRPCSLRGGPIVRTSSAGWSDWLPGSRAGDRRVAGIVGAERSGVAQSAERRPVKPKVASSSLAPGASAPGTAFEAFQARPVFDRYVLCMQTNRDVDAPQDVSTGTDPTVAGLAPAPNPDLAPTDWMTADEIRRRSFSTVERGYAPGEVREYLARLSEWFADLNAQLSRLRKTGDEAGVGTAPPPVEAPSRGEAQELAARMAEILRDAEQHAAKLREDAEARAASMLSQAEQRSASLVSEAEERSAAMLRDAELASNRLRDESGGWAERARAEAEELLTAAREARSSLLAELTSMRAVLEGAHARLGSVPGTVTGETAVNDPSAELGDLAAEVEQPLAFPNGDTPQLDRE
jgi:DivIVA domain-containing protein